MLVFLEKIIGKMQNHRRFRFDHFPILILFTISNLIVDDTFILQTIHRKVENWMDAMEDKYDQS